MADDVLVGNTSGQPNDYRVASDDDGTRQHQYVKVEFGADNVQTKVDSTNPLPVIQSKSATGTQTSVAGSASNVTLLASNASRKGAGIYNDSSAILYVRCQATATTSNFTVKLFSEDYWEAPAGYTGIIDGIWASAAGNARITEFS